ncbi:hypothetical protein HOF56_02015 [Candidatus Peribacteria bacterium]|nr:hypothetical protein [Candidatus Peribacteria bacterium]MBT4021264.1 hypothetical protein [Candidatus Peribacteria bacterium]MBT4240671.1 hypothetical protein [Candidatus Peribacteria bacterium]MBT4474016.1 hypothetical protein [Candidatus Peribacteria bacterium]
MSEFRRIDNVNISRTSKTQASWSLAIVHAAMIVAVMWTVIISAPIYG